MGEPMTRLQRPEVTWKMQVSRAATTVANRHLPRLLLLLIFALGMAQVVRASITFDEGPHLAVGYATLRTGDLRLQPVHIHPPLANVLAAAPLLFQNDLVDPTSVDGWEIASLSAVTDAVVWSYPAPRRIATAGRVPIMLVAVLTGALVYRWAHDLGGIGAGLGALFIYTFDPNILAHGALITTDTVTVFLSIATLYALSRYMHPTPRAAPHPFTRPLALVSTGILLGLAQLAKVSALSLVPVTGLVLLIYTWFEHRTLRSIVGPALARFCAVFGIAAFVVWAGYGFDIGRIEGWPIPLPAATHIAIFRSLRMHYVLGHPTYALGKVSSQGWAWYFPLAFAVKTPLPILLLAAIALARAIHAATRTHIDRRHGLSLSWTAGARSPDRRLAMVQAVNAGLFPLLYASASLFSTVNIGYRHLLPLLPFLAIGIGVALARPRDPGHRHAMADSAARVVLLALLGWLVVGTVRSLPYPLAFFNELAGGPSGGYRFLVDSNLDWGQNLWDLKAWLDTRDHDTVAYAHYSPARPDSYGIQATYLPPDPRAGEHTPWNPRPGLYAIGATVLQGPYAPDINTYAWFRNREPLARLGHALFVYVVADPTAPPWVALCVAGIDPATLPALLGVDTIRVLQPDCEQAYVVPSAESPGLYALGPQQQLPPGSQAWLELRDHEGHTTTRIYQVPSVAPEPPVSTTLATEGPATLLGYALDGAVAHPGETLELTTYWRVTGVPSRPLSLMAHLVSEDGATLAVGDGLGYPVEQWQEDDILMQRHSLTLPADLATPSQLSIETGAYWLDTMERWPMLSGGSSIRLTTLTVEAPR